MTKIIVDDPEWFDENERFTELPSVSGCNRQTYIGEEWVYKRPLGSWAEGCNVREAEHYEAQRLGKRTPHEYYQGIPIAECYLMEDGTLKMRRVKRIRNLRGDEDVPGVSDDILPDWHWRTDGSQVGYDDDGQIVAYDL